MYFLKISVPNWFHAFCWKSSDFDQSTTKQIMKDIVRSKTRKKAKTLVFGWIWTFLSIVLFIHWQINPDEWKWFKGVIFRSFTGRAKLTFSINSTSLITAWTSLLVKAKVKSTMQNYDGLAACLNKKLSLLNWRSNFNSCYVILIEWTFYYFVMCNCMSLTDCVNDNVQFTFFLVMRLNITIAKSCDSFIVILCTLFFSSLKLENGLRKHVRNNAEIKYNFIKLVVILFTHLGSL